MHLLISHTFRGLLGLESSNNRSRSKEGWWEWALRRISIVLQGCRVLRRCRLNPFRPGGKAYITVGGRTTLSWEVTTTGGWKATSAGLERGKLPPGVGKPHPMAKKTYHNLGAQCFHLHQSLPTGPHSNLQDPNFLNQCPHLTVDRDFPGSPGVKTLRSR